MKLRGLRLGKGVWIARRVRAHRTLDAHGPADHLARQLQVRNPFVVFDLGHLGSHTTTRALVQNVSCVCIFRVS